MDRIDLAFASRELRRPSSWIAAAVFALALVVLGLTPAAILLASQLLSP